MATRGAQSRTQKGQSILDFSEEQARDYVEKLLWPDGRPVCRHCGSRNAYRMQGASCRPGLCRCRDCKKQFTVTVGTIFEDSHLPLSTWVKAIHLMASSKKGMSALQLQRNLGIGSYRTAWFLGHRIRLAMKCDGFSAPLKGAVQVDEAYIGGKPRRDAGGKPGKREAGTSKMPVVALIETDGRAHCEPMPKVTAKNLKGLMERHVKRTSVIVTDELLLYRNATDWFAGHETVNHSVYEYVNKWGYTTNGAESFFALLKRGVHGTFHHVGKQHLHRYCDEFSFRWNGRKMQDTERRDEAVKGVEGKRLMYRQPQS